MASPRASWKGTIQLGLLTVPVSVAPATSEEREASLRDLCACHKQPIDGTHKCRVTGKPPEDKVKGVEKSDGTWQELNANAYNAVEAATKSDALKIIDVQPLDKLPTVFSNGTYFVRGEKENRVAADSVAILVGALQESAA